jgi:O-antigen/teichoic acid export membrane protein
MFRAAPLPTPGRFSRPLFGSLLLFGVPMLGSELASVVLMMSDRFFVQSVLGAESLGIYAASWNMCDHLRNALLGAMVGAAYPRCMKLWEQGGASGLQTFVDRFLHVYIMVAAGLVAWTGVLGGELMAVLASPKYAEGGAITGWLMAGLAVQSVMTISAVGLYLARRTLAAMGLVLAAGVLSMLANSLLIPLWGLKGAAIALLAVFLVLNAAQMVVARRTVPLAVPWRSLLRWSFAAALAAWLVTRFSLPDLWLDLLVRSAVLILVYGALVLALDRDLRRWLLAWQLRRKAV